VRRDDDARGRTRRQSRSLGYAADKPHAQNELSAPGTNYGASKFIARTLFAPTQHQEGTLGRGILLWLLGVPIPIIILIALLYH
jgi:hypothetical protein